MYINGILSLMQLQVLQGLADGLLVSYVVRLNVMQRFSSVKCDSCGPEGFQMREWLLTCSHAVLFDMWQKACSML